MLIDENSLKVNNIDFAQYITEVEYGYNKLFSSDTGRNMAGSMVGTFIGNFIKLKLTFKPLTRNQLETIAPILDSATQMVTYYDPVLKRMYEMETYTGDWATSNKNTFSNVARANESFQISFIARKKRVNK